MNNRMNGLTMAHVVNRPRRWSIVLLTVALCLAICPRSARAQDTGRVQVLTGHINPGEFVFYLLPDLKRDQTVYLYVNGTSGNLDPIVAILDPRLDPSTLQMALTAGFKSAIAEGRDPVAAAIELRDRYTLIWDDDSGQGYDAAIEFRVPADGNYRFAVGNAWVEVDRSFFGDYHLTIGLDAPQVLTGEAEPTGDAIAVLDQGTKRNVLGSLIVDAAVQEVAGTLTVDRSFDAIALEPVDPGDTLYAFIEATSGDLRPIIVLRDFGNKPIRTGNFLGEQSQGSLEYTFDEEGRGYVLWIRACCPYDEEVTTGDYRLLLGLNAPEVQTGQAEDMGRPIRLEPIEVKAGVRLEQIVEVNQPSEFFTAVAELQMEWTDPALAFSSDTCHCNFKTYTQDTFGEFVAEAGGRWPDFTLFNQQGNRWTQSRTIIVFSNGRAWYLERFTTNLQADFDFKQYPFDTQRFFIHVDSLYPNFFYKFSDEGGFSEISTEHGEDELIITSFDTSVTSRETVGGLIHSRFTFSFDAPRHLNYYVLRIFLPLLLIIIVSGVTFILRDYRNRIEVASANLLLFIAFSWTIADNYPRLGYLTFLDGVMVVTFVITAIVVVYTVYLRRLELRGDGELADRIDRHGDWIYPLAYIVSFAVLILAFF